MAPVGRWDHIEIESTLLLPQDADRSLESRIQECHTLVARAADVDAFAITRPVERAQTAPALERHFRLRLTAQRDNANRALRASIERKTLPVRGQVPGNESGIFDF